jgi:phosphoadenosine phosphosulfate reductase
MEEVYEMMAKEFEEKKAEEILKWAIEKFGKKVALASSFGAEDVVLIDMLMKIDPSARIFTIDTGRLPQETYDVIEKIMEKYGAKIEFLFPDKRAVEEMLERYGPNLFYKSVELRRLCCHIRKVEPLERILKDLDAWITGLRREQSVTRVQIEKVEEDERTFDGIKRVLIKINPLADWTEKQVWDYIKRNNVPYNALHDRSYPSIGCAPCTRAIKPGEDIRAGRWWWETPEKKECGLHIKQK